MEKKYTPCGGCGAEHPDDRCIGCGHLFEAEEENKYPIGGYAPGNYQCKCCRCGNGFIGDKRAVECERCALVNKELFDAMSPAEQAELIKRNIGIWNNMVKDSGFNPDLLSVMQEAEESKEEDLKRVKEAISDGYPQTPEMDLILRIVSNWGNAIEMPKMEGWVKEYAKTGARWVKASEFKYEVGMTYSAKDTASRGAGRFDEEGNFIWGDRTITKSYEQSDLLILDESAGKSDAVDEWIDVNDRLPEEGGRYWCYMKDLTDLGWSYFQWNCAYNEKEKRFSDSTLLNGEQVTHWRKLPEPPIFKQQKEK